MAGSAGVGCAPQCRCVSLSEARLHTQGSLRERSLFLPPPASPGLGLRAGPAGAAMGGAGVTPVISEACPATLSLSRGAWRLTAAGARRGSASFLPPTPASFCLTCEQIPSKQACACASVWARACTWGEGVFPAQFPGWLGLP